VIGTAAARPILLALLRDVRRVSGRPETAVLITDDLSLSSGRGVSGETPGDGAYRAISTGQLRGLLRFHLRPIDVVVYHGSRRDLVLRRVSRLDAFSGYPVRT
jgi:hypothetical protein